MISKFLKSIERKGRSKNTIINISQVLPRAQTWLNKPLEDATIEDIEKYIDHIKNNGSPSDDVLTSKKVRHGLANGSIHTVVSKFIQFYNFCYDETDDVRYFQFIRKLKKLRPEKPKTSIRPQDLVIPEEVKRLINVATLERDRCIVASFFEGGARMGEMLALDNDMVILDDAKQEVTFNIPNMEGCKTGARSVVCLEIYNYVVDWLKCNPSKKFIPLSPNGLRKVITTLYQRAGIQKPHNIHMLRHSTITHAVSIGMQQNAISMRFWGIPDSNMLSIYIHMSEQIKATAYHRAKGMNGEETTVINPLSVRCVQCGRLIQTGDLCAQCAEIKQLKITVAQLKQYWTNSVKSQT